MKKEAKTYRVMHLTPNGYQISYVKASTPSEAKKAHSKEVGSGKVIQTSIAEW